MSDFRLVGIVSLLLIFGEGCISCYDIDVFGDEDGIEFFGVVEFWWCIQESVSEMGEVDVEDMFRKKFCDC